MNQPQELSKVMVCARDTHELHPAKLTELHACKNFLVLKPMKSGVTA